MKAELQDTEARALRRDLCNSHYSPIGYLKWSTVCAAATQQKANRTSGTLTISAIPHHTLNYSAVSSKGLEETEMINIRFNKAGEYFVFTS